MSEEARTVRPGRPPTRRSPREKATRGQARDEARSMKRRLSLLMETARKLSQQAHALSRRIAVVQRRARRMAAHGEAERARGVLERGQTARAELGRVETLLGQLDADRRAAAVRLARPGTRGVGELAPPVERMENTVERLQARTLAIAALLDAAAGSQCRHRAADGRARGVRGP